MIAVDANILIYAHRADGPFHAIARERLRQLVEGSAEWAVPWPCIHEFIAVTTNRRLFDPPSPLDAALGFVSSLIHSPSLVLISETGAHWSTFRSLLTAGSVTGGRVHDARIAAICLDHGISELWSADRDFGRFPALKVVNPLVQ